MAAGADHAGAGGVGRRLISPVLAGLLLVGWLTGCARSPAWPTPTPTHLRGAGTALLAPLWPQVATGFSAAHPGYSLRYEALPSGLALNELAAGRHDFAFSTDPTAAAAYPDLHFTPVAEDALVLIVHPSVDLTHLTLAQARDLFGGFIQEWGELGAGGGPVRLVGRATGSGARATFIQRVMGDVPLALTTRLEPDDAAVLAYVRDHPGAVGYVSRRALAAVPDGQVRVLRLEDRLPDDPGYALRRTIDVVVPARAAASGALLLRDWLLSPAGQAVLQGGSRP
ncbi:MAG: substrate-binding domain-containing protein [Caldilineales bacterium]|nr:substrate-binding domain-containing protein [Caldilineales bacterium]